MVPAPYYLPYYRWLIARAAQREADANHAQELLDRCTASSAQQPLSTEAKAAMVLQITTLRAQAFELYAATEAVRRITFA